MNSHQTTLNEIKNRKCRLWFLCAYRGWFCRCDAYHDPLKTERIIDPEIHEPVPRLKKHEIDFKNKCVRSDI